MKFTLFPLFALAAIGCGAGSSPIQAQPDSAQAPVPQPPVTAAHLRAQGPAGLSIALLHYDELVAGPEKEKQALLVDTVAGQRYATVSRLYWYTDIQRAKTVSQETGKPILSLRLLGRLDEDFSCANSRMFRTVLYANQTVSSYLKQNFVLHWSSEREVPKVTVDFGEGRTLKTTIAGNSAHYVLDETGAPVDVIPGLYGPKSFLQALEPARVLANEVRGNANARSLVKAYHQKRLTDSEARFIALSPEQQRALSPYRTRTTGTELLAAEMLTARKMVVEMPLVDAAGLGARPEVVLNPVAVRLAATNIEALDASSRALITAMGPTDWGVTPQQLKGAGFEQMISELERSVAGDVLINEIGLRPMISRLFLLDNGADFEGLNTVIYTKVFVTPRTDPWLGLAQPMGFTGLPDDGLVVPQ